MSLCKDDGARLNLDLALPAMVNSAFTFGVIVLLPLLLAAAPVPGTPDLSRRPAVELATATVRIIAAERIRSAPEQTLPSSRDRQLRKREEKLLVEFY